MGIFTMHGAARYFWHDGIYYYTTSNTNPHYAKVAPAPDNGYSNLNGTVTIPEQFTIVDTINGNPITRNYTVDGIYYLAFKGCSNVSEFRLPNSITLICTSAFEGCTSLTKVNIPTSLRQLQNRAFYGCTSLNEITIPESTTMVQDSAFSKCTNLTTINWNATNCTTLTGSDFSGITQVNIGENVQSLPDYFMKNADITTVELPISLKIIKTGAFNNCRSLTEINIPDSVTEIGSGSFYENTSLRRITIGRSVSTVKGNICNRCTNIQQIQWNAINCPSAGSMASASPEAEIILAEGVEVVPRNLFSNTAVKEVHLPSTIKVLSPSCFSSCKRLKSVELPEGLLSVGGGAFSSCDSITSLTIPNTVTTIGSGAFTYMRNLVDLTLSNSLDSVGDELISECLKIGHLFIPKSLRKIGTNAFCTARIKSITVEEGNPILDSRNNCNAIIETATNTLLTASGQLTTIPSSVEAIGDYAFDLCSGPTSYDIPEGVKKIGFRSFFRCWNLQKVTIPSTMDTIGEGAFYYTIQLDTVICKAAVPPVLMSDYCFDWWYNQYATLYVPAGSVDAYKEDVEWKKFCTIVPIGTVLTPGDVNLDGIISIEDAIVLIDMILSGDTAYHPNLDLNWDYKVSIIDVTRLLDMLLNQ